MALVSVSVCLVSDVSVAVVDSDVFAAAPVAADVAVAAAV